MEINMPLKDAKKNKYMYLHVCRAMFFVLIQNPLNTFLILEGRLSLNVLVINLTFYKHYTRGLKYHAEEL